MLRLTADSTDLLAIIKQGGKCELSREAAKPRRKSKKYGQFPSPQFLRLTADSTDLLAIIKQEGKI